MKLTTEQLDALAESCESDDHWVCAYGWNPGPIDEVAAAVAELRFCRVAHDKGRDCQRTEEVLANYKHRALVAEAKLAAIEAAHGTWRDEYENPDDDFAAGGYYAFERVMAIVHPEEKL